MPVDLTAPAKSEPPETGFRVTGRFVLVALLLFFGAIIVMNLVMAKIAISTFAGLETSSSYKAGLAFKAETQAAHRQEEMHWQVDADLVREADGRTRIRVRAADAQGAALQSMTLEANLRHPTKADEDRAFVMRETAPGLYEGYAEPRPGQWNLRLDLLRDGKRVFRSEKRLMLK